MATARRWYFYGVAFVSQLMLYGGVVGLLRETLGLRAFGTGNRSLYHPCCSLVCRSMRFSGGWHSARSGAAQTSAVRRCARNLRYAGCYDVLRPGFVA